MSSISWRERFVVPRVSIAPVSAPCVALPNTDFSSPKCRARLKLTASPRDFFGSSATFIPFPSVKRCVRASRLEGDASNASPVTVAASPL